MGAVAGGGEGSRDPAVHRERKPSRRVGWGRMGAGCRNAEESQQTRIEDWDTSTQKTRGEKASQQMNSRPSRRFWEKC